MAAGGGGVLARRHAFVAFPDALIGFVAPGFSFTFAIVRTANAVFHEDVGYVSAAVHDGGHVAAGKTAVLNVDQEAAGRMRDTRVALAINALVFSA